MFAVSVEAPSKVVMAFSKVMKVARTFPTQKQARWPSGSPTKVCVLQTLASVTAPDRVGAGRCIALARMRLCHHCCSCQKVKQHPCIGLRPASHGVVAQQGMGTKCKLQTCKHAPGSSSPFDSAGYVCCCNCNLCKPSIMGSATYCIGKNMQSFWTHIPA